MSIRLAASKPLTQLRYCQSRLRRMRLVCANDNSASPAEGRIILHAALRHFAAHGLAAAQHAANEALAARGRGEQAEFRWWRDICHALDRRLARTLERQPATGS